MAAAASRARASTRAVPKPETHSVAVPRARPARARPNLARTVVWISVVAALLAGIVALNVAVLQLRMERGRVQADIVEIRTENARLEADISAEAARGRVEAAAGGRLGLVRPQGVTYLKLENPRR